MANVKLIFKGTLKSNTNDKELEVLRTLNNEIVIFLQNDNCVNHICLDKQTSVRLVRELKKQIGFLDLEGGENGNR